MKMTRLKNGDMGMDFSCAPALTGIMLGIKAGECADPTDFLEALGMDAAQAQASDVEMCVCDTSLCNTASKKSLRNLPWKSLDFEHCYLIFSFDWLVRFIFTSHLSFLFGQIDRQIQINWIN